MNKQPRSNSQQCDNILRYTVEGDDNVVIPFTMFQFVTNKYIPK